MKKENEYKNKKIDFLLEYQENILSSLYYEKDRLLEENKKLNLEIAKLNRTIHLNNDYINYLITSYWWKATFPFRKFSRVIRKKHKKEKYNFVENLPIEKPLDIKEKVSVVIYTCNPGKEFSLQLKNIFQQKFVDNLEVIVIDRGSSDGLDNVLKNFKVKLIKDNGTLTSSQLYEKYLSKITGKYVVFMEQNVVINTKFWIYQSLRPIIEKKCVSTIFFKHDASLDIEKTYYDELKRRYKTIANNKVLFFPKNRDVIQYISPIILDKTTVIVKERISNLFLL